MRLVKYSLDYLILNITVTLLMLTFSEQVQGRAMDMIDPTCSPPPNPTKPHYLIGYGSLLNLASKARTYPNSTGHNIPVTINGFSRAWNARSNGVGFGTTFLGIFDHPSASFNGIVFELKSDNITKTLQDFDQRERSYCRRQVKFEDLNFTAWNSNVEEVLKNSEFWIYVNKKNLSNKPSGKFPIVQSYVDVFLTGCLEVEAEFHLQDYAKQCITMTQDWGFHWINDRIYPRRAFIHVPKAEEIDTLLASILPKEFSQIQIE